MNRFKSLIQSARPHWLPLALILFTTALVFLPVLWCDLVDYDDPSYINTDVWVTSPISWRSVWALWNQSVLSLWHPLTSLTLHLIYQVAGLKPWGYHGASLLFHLGSAGLVYVLFAMLTGKRWRSACVSIFFAVHPLRVESVAWAAEIKDVGCVFFGLACMIGYVVYVRHRSWPALALSTVFLAMSMLYKPMLVMMPVLLLLLDFWPLGRVGRSVTEPESWSRLILEKTPLFLVVAGISSYIFWLKRNDTLEGMGIPRFPLWLRLSNIPVSYVRYLGKMAWFDGLTYHYTMPAAWPVWAVLGSTLLVMGISAVTLVFRRECPMWVAGWWWFIISIVPVIGLHQVSDYSLADRYTYFSSIGLLVMVFFWLPDRYFQTPGGRRIAAGVAVFFVMILGVTTRSQISHWRNGMALYAWGFEVDPNDPLSHVGLGGACIVSNRYDLAARHLREAVRIDPNCAQARYRLSVLAQIQGHPEEAMNEARITAQVAPGLATGWAQMGHLYLLERQNQKAVECLERAFLAEPQSAALASDLASAYLIAGMNEKAAGAFKEALALGIEPAPTIHWNLGLALARLHRWDEAKEQFRISTLAKPGHESPEVDLGVELVRVARWSEGLGQLEIELSRNPGNFNALLYSGVALGRMGQSPEAISRINRAIKLRPDSAAAHDAMADVLARVGRSAEAVAHLDAADQIDPRNPARSAVRRMLLGAGRSSTQPATMPQASPSTEPGQSLPSSERLVPAR